MRVGQALLGLLGITFVSANACSSDPGPASSTAIGVTGAGTGTTSGGEGGQGGAPAPCVPECEGDLSCCDGICVNVQNDVHHCGNCIKNCPGPHAYCAAGECDQAPCSMQNGCMAGEFCCGALCCPFESLCCTVNGAFECTTPNENDTCPP